ncbi:unnamed protein product [Closterium sp. NIES-53]
MPSLRNLLPLHSHLPGLKKDVLKQMPPKKEQILRVDLAPLQRSLYRAVLTRNYQALTKASGQQFAVLCRALTRNYQALTKASGQQVRFTQGTLYLCSLLISLQHCAHPQLPGAHQGVGAAGTYQGIRPAGAFHSWSTAVLIRVLPSTFSPYSSPCAVMTIYLPSSPTPHELQYPPACSPSHPPSLHLPSQVSLTNTMMRLRKVCCHPFLVEGAMIVMRRLYRHLSLLTHPHSLQHLPQVSLTNTMMQLRKVSLTNTMMQLRKVCCHPFLVEGVEEQHGGGDTPAEASRRMVAASDKLALLERMLERLKAGGHRVLVYSQFKRMLDLLQEWLMGKVGGSWARWVAHGQGGWLMGKVGDS